MISVADHDMLSPSRLLAERASAAISGDKADPLDIQDLNNLFRLLSGYDAHRYMGLRCQRDWESEATADRRRVELAQLAQAIDDAVQSTFRVPDISAAMPAITRVLRSAAFPATAERPEASELACTCAFIDALAINLGSPRHA